MMPQYEFTDELLTSPSLTMLQDAIEITFKIPVINRKTYRMLKLISIPIIQGDEMLWIEPNCANIAIHEQDAQMIPNPIECQQIGSQTMCPTANPTNDNYKLHCELSLWYNSTIHDDCIVRSTTSADTWIRISDKEWIFVVPAQRTVQVNDTIININGSGILSYIMKNQTQINNTFLVSDETRLFIPTVNLTQHRKYHHINCSFDARGEMDQINATLKKLKATTEWNVQSTSSALGPYAAIIASTVAIIVYMRQTLRKFKAIDHNKFFKDTANDNNI